MTGIGLMLPVIESLSPPPAEAAASMVSGCTTPANGCGEFPDCDKGECIEQKCSCVAHATAKVCVCRHPKKKKS